MMRSRLKVRKPIGFLYWELEIANRWRFFIAGVGLVCRRIPMMAEHKPLWWDPDMQTKLNSSWKKLVVGEPKYPLKHREGYLISKSPIWHRGSFPNITLFSSIFKMAV